MNKSLRIAALAVLGVVAVGAHALSLGQIDTFQSGTNQGWTGGASPTNIPDGGPLGAGDRYLRITSNGGSGPGGRLATFNPIQWQGDYIGTGVRMIECDLNNLGATFLNIRVILISIFDDRFSSTVAIDLPPGSGWVHAYIPIAEADLIQVQGENPFSTAGSQIQQIMLRHNPVPDPQGVPIVAQLGIDNVLAHAGFTISGNLNLQDLAPGVPPPSQVLFEYRNPGTFTTVYSAPAAVAPNGDYTVWSPPVPGSYDVSVKVSHWLRRTVNVPSTNGDVTGFDLSLLNGDCDNDNEITIGDYAILSAAFGSAPGDPNWDPNADLDGDEEVTIGDYAILSSNFGEVGDD